MRGRFGKTMRCLHPARVAGELSFGEGKYGGTQQVIILANSGTRAPSERPSERHRRLASRRRPRLACGGARSIADRVGRGVTLFCARCGHHSMYSTGTPNPRAAFACLRSAVTRVRPFISAACTMNASLRCCRWLIPIARKMSGKGRPIESGGCTHCQVRRNPTGPPHLGCLVARSAGPCSHVLAPPREDSFASQRFECAPVRRAQGR